VFYSSIQLLAGNPLIAILGDKIIFNTGFSRAECPKHPGYAKIAALIILAHPEIAHV
jgi:hypothetical protein